MTNAIFLGLNMTIFLINQHYPNYWYRKFSIKWVCNNCSVFIHPENNDKVMHNSVNRP